MNRKVVAIWVTFIIVLSFIVIIVEIAPVVKAQTTWYVDDVPGSGGPGDPPEDFTFIQDAIDASSDGDTVYVYNGTYNENVIVDTTVNLIGEDWNNCIINGNGLGTALRIQTNSTNVTGFTLTNEGCGLVIQRSSYCNITKNKILNNSAWGINLFESKYNNISGNIISSNINFGLYIDESNENTVYNNSISDHLYGLNLYHAMHNNIHYNNFTDDGVFITGDQLIQFDSHEISTTNKVNGKPLIYYINSTGFDIDNESFGQLILVNCSDISIINLQILKTDSGIQLAYSSNITIKNCNISFNSLNAIFLISTLNCTIIDNSISNNNCGVYFLNATRSVIKNNSIIGDINSIWLQYSINNNITENSVDGYDYGITIKNSLNNNVTKNNIFAADLFSIAVYTSSYNNSIYHNNILNNNNLAYDDTDSGNRWDNGYPSGGNYWDDWTTPDNDRDGFVDNPYIISGGSNQDNYPFSHKWGWDLVAHWPFDEGMGQYANETSGNYNDGILGGSLNIEDSDPEWVNGIYGNALKFDCVDDYVKVPASDSLNVTGSLTIEAWIYPFSEGYDYIMYVVARQNAYEMGLNYPAKNHIRFELQTSPSSSIYVSSNGEVNLDRWNHIVVTVDSNELKMYINGELDRSLSGKNVSGVSISNLSIGSASSGSGVFFNGIIDEVYIWNRVLTPTEIQDNYRNGLADSIFLSRGWNLISIPNIQSDKNLYTVLSSINGSYDSVQYYNISDISDHWKHNHNSKLDQLNDLKSIDHTMGFWLHVTTLYGVLFKFSGTQPTSNQTIPLHPGWNMMGYPSLTSYNRTEGLNNLTFNDQVNAIWSFDAVNQKWEEMGESDFFQIGRGYYIHAKSECEWEVPL